VQPQLVSFRAKTEYGLLALLELARVQSSGEVLQVAEIAQLQEIPDRYLEQMLTDLRKAGILRSIRGPRGGYQLARPATELTIAEVVACLEGENAVPDDRRGGTPAARVVASLRQRLEQARQSVLEGTTLQDLHDQQRALTLADSMYFI
jgi:Rrf2 family protein